MGTGGSGLGASGAGGSIVTPLPTETDPKALIPTRIRRLTNAEYEASARALTGTSKTPTDNFAPDARQSGYTVNAAQRVDAVLVRQIASAADELAKEVKASKLSELAPCSNAQSQGKQCATTFIEKIGARAYRRPLTGDETTALLGLYDVGANGATYADGIELVLRGLLQSAGFLYLTELGAGTPAAGQPISLTQHEIASSLSYVLTASPPDQELLTAAASGQLATVEGREREARRMIQKIGGMQGGSPARVVRVVREWLGVDKIDATDKDANVYQKFRDLKPAIAKESHDFVNAVLGSTGSISELLSANWSMVDQNLASQLYGASGSGKVTLPNRIGILNQAAFLSAYAHATESGPVLRGVAVGRRLACVPIGSPALASGAVTIPPPDTSRTTRERFTAHLSAADCKGCHALIDPIGFTFEQFDGMGAHRTTDNGKAVDSATTVTYGKDFDGSYADSNALAKALAASADVRQCFARQVFRASTGWNSEARDLNPGTTPAEMAAVEAQSAAALASEDAFVATWQTLPADQQGKVIETLMAFVKSPLFTHRRAQ